jgi:hypothetical protein
LTRSAESRLSEVKGKAPVDVVAVAICAELGLVFQPVFEAMAFPEESKRLRTG